MNWLQITDQVETVWKSLFGYTINPIEVNPRPHWPFICMDYMTIYAQGLVYYHDARGEPTRARFLRPKRWRPAHHPGSREHSAHNGRNNHQQPTSEQKKNFATDKGMNRAAYWLMNMNVLTIVFTVVMDVVLIYVFKCI